MKCAVRDPWIGITYDDCSVETFSYYSTHAHGAEITSPSHFRDGDSAGCTGLRHFWDTKQTIQGHSQDFVRFLLI